MGLRNKISFLPKRKLVDRTTFAMSYLRFLKVLIQEFNIMLDKGFMLSVYDIFAHQMPEEEMVCKRQSSNDITLFVYTA